LIKIAIKKVERVKTKIQGFDELVEGGIPKGHSVLVTGGPGTGKSIFCMEFLVNGAKLGENGLYVSFEQNEEDIKTQSMQFGWDLEKIKNITLLCINVKYINKKTIDRIKQVAKKNKVKRLVVDSLSTLIVNAPIYEDLSKLGVTDFLSNRTFYSPPIIGDNIVNKFLYNFIDEVKSIKECTTLITAEASEDGMSNEIILGEYSCDGVIRITFESLGGDYSRSLIVRKMRMTKNDENVHPMEISSKGVIVHSLG
jgi:KaiC/GvpD/RAD55 family RecA-like ATPase